MAGCFVTQADPYEVLCTQHRDEAGQHNASQAASPSAYNGDLKDIPGPDILRLSSSTTCRPGLTNRVIPRWMPNHNSLIGNHPAQARQLHEATWHVREGERQATHRLQHGSACTGPQAAPESEDDDNPRAEKESSPEYQPCERAPHA